MEERQGKRRLRVDLTELEVAFDHAAPEVIRYLDGESRKVILITEDVRSGLEQVEERVAESGPDSPTAFAAALAEQAFPIGCGRPYKRHGELKLTQRAVG